MSPTNRLTLATLAVALTAVTARAALPLSPISIATQSIFSLQAVDITSVPDDHSRLFTAFKSGPIYLFKNNTQLQTPFLSLAASPAAGGAGIPIAGTNEGGLLGLAFHPNYAAPSSTPGSGTFYTFTTETYSASQQFDFSNPELSPSNSGPSVVIREWSVDTANPDRADLAAGSRVLLRINRNSVNHYGGTVRFGPDGYLYISLGDGGGEGLDGDSPTSTSDGHANPYGNAQTLINSDGSTNALGKILRIDPLAPSLTPNSPDAISANGQYRVPSSNPFSTGPAQNEIFAYGLRNPYRISFDRATGLLYAADAGQSQREEVDRISPGGNYGWAILEGTRPTNIPGRPTPPNFSPVAPLAEYTHADGGVVAIGGVVYRGNNIPALYGQYVFADYSLGLLYTDPAGGGPIYRLRNVGSSIDTVAEDATGELLFSAESTNAGTFRLLPSTYWRATTGGSWNSTSTWAGGIPNSTAARANFLTLTTTAANPTGVATVTLDGDKTVGDLLFNHTLSYSIKPGTGGTLTLAKPGPDAPTLKVISGSHRIAAPLSLADLPALIIAAHASLQLASPLTGQFGPLSLAPTATLDITTITLPLASTDLPTLRSYLRAGQLTSSSPDANDLLSLGYTLNDPDSPTPQILVRLTPTGDANLNGAIDPDDYALLDKGFAQHASTWSQGDFNYDGTINSQDYFLIDRALLLQAQGSETLGLLAQRESQFGATYVTQLLASVPEPTSLVACGFAIPALLTRRRQQR